MNISQLLSSPEPAAAMAADTAASMHPADDEVYPEQTFIGRVSNKSSTLSTILSYTPTILTDSAKSVVNLDQLDKFACNQLDKLEQRFPILGNSSSLSGGYDEYIIERQPKQTGWTSVVTSVPSNIGSMVISDDLLKGLKYCLNWIETAKLHIDDQMRILREYILSYISPPSKHTTDYSQHMAPTTSAGFVEVLNHIKRELVSTLRSVVDVVGRYAAIYLPNDARQSVRGFILSLPTKWASTPAAPTSAAVTQTPTPPLSPLAQANKVVSFGTESSDMLKGVHSVFGQTLDGAENLLGRKVVYQKSEEANASSTSASSVNGDTPMDIAESENGMEVE